MLHSSSATCRVVAVHSPEVAVCLTHPPPLHPPQVVARADVLFVCVKPGGVKTLLQEVAPVLGSRHLVVSIAAGVTLADLQAAAGPEARVVRVMPNTPAMVGASTDAGA